MFQVNVNPKQQFSGKWEVRSDRTGSHLSSRREFTWSRCATLLLQPDSRTERWGLPALFFFLFLFRFQCVAQAATFTVN